MNVNKKLDRFKQWTTERMGGEVKTSVSEDFKAMETETAQRQDGMEKMHRFTANYVKSVSKRAEGEHKEKLLPIAQLGGAMIQHGEEFEHDSQYGQCLTTLGRTQERIARSQESYISAATNTWLESLERGLVQMKEYQAARKKLETRRLAYDTSLAKMQKAKKEDFRVEEELRSQKAKYEEAEEDVYRRMLDLKDSEAESVVDLTSFLDAQLTYHDKCREALLQLKDEWPASRQQQQPQSRHTRPVPRSRSNTARSYMSTQSIDERPTLEIRTAVRPGRGPSSHYQESPVEYEDRRPAMGRSTTYDPSIRSRRDLSPVFPERLARVPSDSIMIQHVRSNLKSSNNHQADSDVFADDSTFYTNSSDRSYGDRSFSPTNSHGSGSITPLTMKKKAPPPPPPSRASKPAPPPPPTKRTLITSQN